MLKWNDLEIKSPLQIVTVVIKGLHAKVNISISYMWPIFMHISLSAICRATVLSVLFDARHTASILHRAPPGLQVVQNFLTQKIVADPKMRSHQNSFGIWCAILGKKTCLFSLNMF